MSKSLNPAKDVLDRPLRDLRISVTDQCNFRCTYCMPKELFGSDYPFLPKEELLSFDEIIRLTKQFVQLGVKKIRLTGGEPLLRKDLDKLIERLSRVEGITDIALTTNGILLPMLAQKLKDAGLERVNISLDALDDQLFTKINGRNVKTDHVLKGIEAALSAELEVKVNMVVKRGLNDSQIVPMARFFREKGLIIRFIEFMDVGNTNRWNLNAVVSKQEIFEMIHAEIPLEQIPSNYFGEVATRYRYKDSKEEIGIISSVTDSFCGGCTRARISADGKIYTCLFASNSFDIRSLLRSEIHDQVLKQELIQLWTKRSDRYSDERRENGQQRLKHPKVEMSYIGG